MQRDVRGRTGQHQQYIPSVAYFEAGESSDFLLKVYSGIKFFMFILNSFCRFILATLLKTESLLLFLNIERNSFTQQIV